MEARLTKIEQLVSPAKQRNVVWLEDGDRPEDFPDADQFFQWLDDTDEVKESVL